MQFKALFSVSLEEFPKLIDRLTNFGVIHNWLYTSDCELEVSGRWTYPLSNTVFNESDKVIRIEIEQNTTPKTQHIDEAIENCPNSWDL